MAEKNSLVDVLQDLITARLLDVNTAIPAKIVSYSNGMAKVKPVGKKRFADGDALEYPTISGVRVCFPSFSGGQAGMKGAVLAGDDCMLIFSQQAADGTDDRRMFDLSDAYAVMVNLGKVGAGDSSNNDDMTMYYGSAYIRLTKSGKLIINAPAGVEIDTPSTLNTGTLTTEGLLSYQDGLTGQDGGNSTTISGNLNHSGGSIISNGVTLHTHTHNETGTVTDSPNAG